MHVERPTVGLLNVGTEEIKGVEEVKEASKLLREAQFPIWTIEASLKAIASARAWSTLWSPKASQAISRSKPPRGTATQIKNLSARGNGAFPAYEAWSVLARGAFEELRTKLDTRNINGGVFLGLNGVVIKSHGGMDAVGFARAVEIGYEMVRDELLAKSATPRTSPMSMASLRQTPSQASSLRGHRNTISDAQSEDHSVGRAGSGQLSSGVRRYK